MAISSLPDKILDSLISDKIFSDNSFRDKSTKIREKYDIVVRSLGIDPDASPCKGHTVTYDEYGHANTPFYLGKDLTKEEIFAILRDNGAVSKGLLGKFKLELLLGHAFPNIYCQEYAIVKREDKKGNIKYRIEWKDPNFW